MKFQFKEQAYQVDAVESVVKVFNGQPYQDRISYLIDKGVASFAPQQIAWEEISDDGMGFANARINLSDEQLLENINSVQTSNNIKQSSGLVGHLGRCSLDIEMETGTGKTYVYIRTMFELNRRYGWSKFIVVVPSIAIREGVAKSFDMTEEHFFQIYGKKIRRFIYNSSNLTEIDRFSSSKDIYCMIINSQAFASSLKEGAKNETARIIYSKQDSFRSRRPIDVIAANRPIIILDEPQKLGGEATQTSLKRFNSLFTINYSATHKESHNPVYVLDALDAYNQKLVKKIEVKGFELKNLRGTHGYVYLSEIVLSKDQPPKARIGFEINYKKGINREMRLCSKGYDLYANSGNNDVPPLEQYKDGYVVNEINPLANTVTFVNGLTISCGQADGNVSERDQRRVQIRETIESHFEKEEKLFNKGIKCLSLFFIDEVSKYRQYDEDGNELLGEYGVMFEQEYESVLNDYLTLIDSPYTRYLKGISSSETHNGYFSIDKKTNRIVNSSINKKSGISDDISAYDLILKNKERLLSFDEPTRFIFSHSALREGWDNPNIFQICTLKQSDSTVTKRQEVGRGMRLCVDSNGIRQDLSVLKSNIHEVNRLTVIASDSYKNFVTGLQAETKEALYDRPTKATSEYFKGKMVKDSEGNVVRLDEKMANTIEFYLIGNGYIDIDRNVTDKYRADKDADCLVPMPEQLKPYEKDIHKLVSGIFDESVLDDMIEDASKAKIANNKLNENFNKKEFQKLWNYINHKYAYKVSFDSGELVEKAIEAIDRELYVSQLQYTIATGRQKDNISLEQVDRGESFTQGSTSTKTLKISEASSAKYDLIGKICKVTGLTRKTVATILKGIRSDKFAMFRNNPEEFISKVGRLINEQMSTMIVDHITYDVTEQTYDSDIFTSEKGSLTLDRAIEAKLHVTDYVVTDSQIERNFAEELEHHDKEVCVYAKLPKSFSIPTPVGDYSPDWAIAFYEGTVKHIYFVAETKGSMSSMILDKIESAKTSCARKLFEKLSNGAVRYDVVDNYQHLMDIMNK